MSNCETIVIGARFTNEAQATILLAQHRLTPTSNHRPVLTTDRPGNLNGDAIHHLQGIEASSSSLQPRDASQSLLNSTSMWASVPIQALATSTTIPVSSTGVSGTQDESQNSVASLLSLLGQRARAVEYRPDSSVVLLHLEPPIDPRVVRESNALVHTHSHAVSTSRPLSERQTELRNTSPQFNRVSATPATRGFAPATESRSTPFPASRNAPQTHHRDDSFMNSTPPQSLPTLITDNTVTSSAGWPRRERSPRPHTPSNDDYGSPGSPAMRAILPGIDKNGKESQDSVYPASPLDWSLGTPPSMFPPD